MSRAKDGRIFQSRQCENCNEQTWVKPRNGTPRYCGVCGHNLQTSDGLKSTRGPPYRDEDDEGVNDDAE